MGHGPSNVHRPTENAATSGKYSRPLPPVSRLRELIAMSRASRDRCGMQLFGCMLERHQVAEAPALSDRGVLALVRLEAALGGVR
ncbi:hypothetical protein [Streptantibioticus silvisoli]|uniref:Uncharacterized protein n=1 Tax=Streptantibioticus silvisoli TaxID=2705255 RepID=A0ABT6W258_9ACTN|nr:hypothetical protein [Streptantibioticus silvisoli]MDI5964831.1 hypothetical protein [Streptantibioticus silvisoli]